MPSSPTAATTIVVGGGVAGLMCARELARSGHAVTLLERADTVGGRVRTTLHNGFRLDHGFQVLFSAYPTLVAALDLPALRVHAFQPAARIADGGRIDGRRIDGGGIDGGRIDRRRIDGGGIDGGRIDRTSKTALIGDALADLSLLLPTLVAPQLSLFDKLRMLRLRYAATSMSFDDCFRDQFDRVTTRAYLEASGFSARAIDSFFAPFYGGILLDRSLATSASVLLYTFKMLAQGRTVVPELGMGAITAQLAAQLPANTVRANAAVAEINCVAERITGVTLQSGETLSADRVVLACDPPTIAILAAAIGVNVAVPASQLGCTTVYFASSAPLLHGTALWLNSAPNATVSHAITISNVAPSYAPAGKALTAATVLGDAAKLLDDELVARVRADLGAMCGAPEPVQRAELLAVWRVPYSQYAQPPGSTVRRVQPQTAQAGLFIASEIGHTSSLEGAARGGVAAAHAVLGSAKSR